jgi:hypothetical protein
MANTYTWTFPTLEVNNNEQNGFDDVISQVHWRITAVHDTATNADGQPLSVSAYGSAGLTLPPEGHDGFIAFDSVTQDNVKAWVLDNIGKTEAEMEAMLTAQMDELISPTFRNATPSGW